MKRDLQSEARRWLLQAKYDLDDANFSLEGERFNLACFLSQQAAEKALKAFLIANKKEPWGHSVAELCETASVKDSDFRNIKKRAATEDADRALSICNEVIDLVEKKIGNVRI